MNARTPSRGDLGRLLAQGLERVLRLSGHRRDRHGLVDRPPCTNSGAIRSRREARLAHERSHRGGASHPARPLDRELHALQGNGRGSPAVRYRRAMEPKKRWDGYTSFSYLEAGADYVEFDLEPQLGRVERFVVPLDPEQEERAARLERSCVRISLHDHAGVSPKDWNHFDAYVREGREWYGFEGLAASGLDAVFENFLDGTSTVTSKAGWKWTDVIADVGMHLADVAHQSLVVVGTTVRTSSMPTSRGASR